VFIVNTPGTGYKLGHRILIIGTDIGQSGSDYDLILTVSQINNLGGIMAVTYELVNSGFYATGEWPGVSGTRAGNVIDIFSLVYNLEDDTFTLDVWNNGSNYVAGDVVNILGTNITNSGNALESPANDITLTVDTVRFDGEIDTFTLTGTIPRPQPAWRENNISDGGNDEYDTGNYIDSSFATEISYNNGQTVVDGTSAFGEGSSYSFVYQEGIFGLLVTDNLSTRIGTSGNGPDSGSTIISGNIYGPNLAAQTFENAVTYINLVGSPYTGSPVTFTKTDYGDEVDILIADDGDGAGIGITRDNNGGIYNTYREGEWDEDVSPGGTLWNIGGWTDISDVEQRNYVPLYEAFGFGGLGNKIVGAECIMYLPDNGKYYTVQFTQWTQNNNGGGFAYTRRELNLDSLQEGIRFSDGTTLKSAEGIGRVKLESPGQRKIEEVFGYKQVSVTGRTTINLNTVASRNASGDYRFWIDSTNTTIDDILNDTGAAGITDTNTIEFSLDNNTWYVYSGGTNSDGNERGYGVNLEGDTLTYNQGDTVYFRYQSGGVPVVWWDKNELPGGSANFRGAVIDYHAYTGDSTIIGTIHIVDDDGEDHITHTEVQSGTSDGENDDLWYVTSEGQIRYRRIDGESATLKIQWAAKVFYGSELYD
jgi:hypothetical protein